MDDNRDPMEYMNDDNTLDENKMKDLILDDLVKMITDMLDISPTDIRPDTIIPDELDLDSLQLYELVVDLEEVYSIRMPDEDLDNVKTVKDIVDLVFRLSTQPEK
ncbi:MAG: acyl carrier protein [Clostridiales bacterium]|nr:acyl carrier protein [Clostridiales bacterium]